MEKDSVSAEKMLPQNWKRVIRCLEVIHLTGEPIWKHQQDYTRQSELEFIQFGLNWDRPQLYNRINSRVDTMIELGLVDEVASLLNRGYSKNLNSLNTVGYKELITYLDKEISLDRAIELIKRNTRHYAKRQLTWFRKDNRIKWLNIDAESDLDNLTAEILKIL
jgi:tRNA dimethylallyltransferase